MKSVILFMISSLSVLIGCKPSGYNKKNGSWFYKESLIEEADPTTFTVLNSNFAKDRKQGFFRGAVVKGSSGRSFVALNKYYAKDAFKAFFCYNYGEEKDFFFYKHSTMLKIDKVDIKTFHCISETYAADQNDVYFKGVKFLVKDAKSFEELTYGFSKDDYSAYYGRVEMEGSDGKSFVSLDLNYAKDKNKVYYTGLQNTVTNNYALKGADPKTFLPLGFGYSKDKKHVFYREIIISAMPDKFKLNFETINRFDATDGAHQFLDGKQLN